jgi:hypothetical protein
MLTRSSLRVGRSQRSLIAVRRARRRFAPLFVLVSVVLLPLGSANVGATPYGYPNPGYVYDGLDHGFCFDSTFSSTDFVYSAMQYLDDNSNLYDQYTSTCGSSTDIVWAAADYDPDGIAATYCWTWGDFANHVCDQFVVVVNDANHWRLTAECGGDANQLTSNYTITIRHELGHTVGLSHWSFWPGDCGLPNTAAYDTMVSDWITGNPWPYFIYDASHHVPEIHCKCPNP